MIVSHAAPAAKRIPMMSVDAARAAMLAHAAALDDESVTLDHALGRTLSRNVAAACDQPPFTASAMDGYALRNTDTPGVLKVTGESAAGRGFEGTCGAGQAVRISTGAAVPDGADTIAIQEDVRRSGDKIEVPQTPAGRWLRPRGSDFRQGAVLLDAGRRLDGIAVALAAAAGAAELHVSRRPRVAILCSGDELAAPGASPGPYQVFDSATFGVAALARGWGAEAERLAIEQDDAAAIAHAAETAMAGNDLLVVIGGASVGDHDHAMPALLRLGLELAVDRIAVRPGKPTWFGRVGKKPVLGLPGNPASALVCAHLFLKPLLDAMLGHAAPPAFTAARLTRALPKNGPREHYLRARMEGGADGVATVRAFEDQDSSLLSVFAAANALIRLAPDMPALAAGALVDVLPLDAR